MSQNTIRFPPFPGVRPDRDVHHPRPRRGPSHRGRQGPEALGAHRVGHARVLRAHGASSETGEELFSFFKKIYIEAVFFV